MAGGVPGSGRGDSALGNGYGGGAGPEGGTERRLLCGGGGDGCRDVEAAINAATTLQWCLLQWLPAGLLKSK